jgi:hypothetical protein
MPGIRRKHIDFDNVSFEETPPKSESVTFEEDLRKKFHGTIPLQILPERGQE